MTESRPSIEEALDGMSPEEAFDVLAHELRLEIIKELWDSEAHSRHDAGHEPVNQVTFTGLRRKVEIEDSGRFNYHLRKLTPYFVENSEKGYRLSEAGTYIARTIHALSETK